MSEDLQFFDVAEVPNYKYPSCGHTGKSWTISRHLSCAEDHDRSPGLKRDSDDGEAV